MSTSSLKDDQMKLGKFLTPKQEVMKTVTGSLIYHEGSGFKSKLIMGAEVKEVLTELKDKNGNFLYQLDIPLCLEAKEDYIKSLRKNMDVWPMLLWIRKKEKVEM